jgi:hypothetical protein
VGLTDRDEFTKTSEGSTVIEITTRSAEAAEAQIATFIERMDTKRRDTEGERLEEELYVQSVRRFNERARAGSAVSVRPAGFASYPNGSRHAPTRGGGGTS